MATHLPELKPIRDLLINLLGREVSIAPADPLVPSPENPCTVAVYVDERLHICALWVLDVGLSAAAGVSLGLLPPDQVDTAQATGQLSQMAHENLAEVLNIAASLFNLDTATHLRLHEVVPAGTTLRPDLRSHALTLGRRTDATVEIAGYGGGGLSVVMLR